MGNITIKIDAQLGEKLIFLWVADQYFNIDATSSYHAVAVEGRHRFAFKSNPQGYSAASVTADISHNQTGEIVFRDSSESEYVRVKKGERKLLTFQVGAEYTVEYDGVVEETEQKVDITDLLAQSFVATLSYSGARVCTYGVTYFEDMDAGLEAWKIQNGKVLSIEGEGGKYRYDEIKHGDDFKLNTFADYDIKFYFEAVGDGRFIISPNTRPRRWLGVAYDACIHSFEKEYNKTTFRLLSKDDQPLKLEGLESVGNKAYLEVQVGSGEFAFISKVQSSAKSQAGKYWWSWLRNGGGEVVLFDINIVSKGVKATYDGGPY